MTENKRIYAEKLRGEKRDVREVKVPKYRDLIPDDIADQLYKKIVEKVIVQKKYKEANYLAKDLAKDLHTNTRYLSAVINTRFGMNYSRLVNTYRIREALSFLTDKRCPNRSVESISAMVGFANRQSFYAAFAKQMNESPNEYRKNHLHGTTK